MAIDLYPEGSSGERAVLSREAFLELAMTLKARLGHDICMNCLAEVLSRCPKDARAAMFRHEEHGELREGERRPPRTEIVRSRVETSYHGHTIVTEVSSADGAVWAVKVTVLHDYAEHGTWVIKRLESSASATFRTSTGAARAGMLLGRDWIEHREHRELPMTLVIVDRNRPELVEGLSTRFAGDPNVRIVFDRRISLGVAAVGERRWDAEGLSAVLSNKGYLVVRTD